MGLTSTRARAALVTALGVFCQGQLAAGTAWADAPDGGMETHHGPSLITIDNSNADSWLEVDRTANVLAPLSKGTAGSDHDGGGGAIDQNVSASRGVGVQAAPDESGEEDEEEEAAEAATPARDPDSGGAATGGDDDEGDADTERDARAAAAVPPSP
ncbi:hypothetical protein [Streptomyces sp. PTD5-9]|uniref:hypothetical protein n=1 Tax=Streptomyces sp. PTD5-9 TaxID=3120150 RepID=UPI0030084CDA